MSVHSLLFETEIFSLKRKEIALSFLIDAVEMLLEGFMIATALLLTGRTLYLSFLINAVRKLLEGFLIATNFIIRILIYTLYNLIDRGSNWSDALTSFVV